MSNTLTGLIPTIYAALDTVSRELVGMIPAVSRDSTAERGALNQPIRSAVAPAVASADNTPGVSAPNTGDQTLDYVDMTIQKSKHVPIRWNGEEQRGVINAGNYGTILQDQFAQAFRTLTNEIELDLCSLYVAASRAYGTAGTTPFATKDDLSDVAGVRQILDDNGVPQSDLRLVIGTAAMANVRGKQASLFKSNEAGTDELLRRGTIGLLEGFSVHNSGQTKFHTKGTAASYAVDLGGGYAAGSTTLHLDTGTGTHIAGDVLTIAGDANKYVIGTGAAGSGDKDIVLNKPGLLAAAADDALSPTGNSYRANLAFHKNAIQLATRVPAMPIGPDGKAMDMADDIMTVVDPVSGLAFEIAVYRQFMQLVYHVRLAWGVKAVKSEHIAILLG